MNENENTTFQCFWESAKTALMGKFVVLNVVLETNKNLR